MKAIAVAAALSALSLTAACAPVIEGGPPIALPPGVQETAQVGAVFMSSGWLNSEEDFAETFSDEVHEELRRCMWGTAIVDVRVHLDDMHRADRLESVLAGGGEHALTGTVEFVDPARGNLVLGRFPVTAVVQAQSGPAALVEDRQMVVSEAFGRAVCEEAFGRNPRERGPHNATGG
jgi:hypothetical protein